MVFSWLKGKAQRKFASMQREELQQFVNMLEGVGDEEAGLVCALAANFRNEVIDICDLSDPLITVGEKIPLTFVRHYQDLQKQGLQVIAPGVAVWLHTARAVHTPENRNLARTMWSEIARGIPYAPEAADSFYELTGRELSIEGHETLPIGFEHRS